MLFPGDSSVLCSRSSQAGRRTSAAEAEPPGRPCRTPDCHLITQFHRLQGTL